MGNFKDKFARFMYGRYGADQLYYALLVFYFVLLIANIFIKSSVLGILMWAVLICIFFRVFSRDIYKRQLENKKFINIWSHAKAKGSLTTRRIKEIKTHRFRQCPHCKTTLRLPRRTGKHLVKCPRCLNNFSLRIFW